MIDSVPLYALFERCTGRISLTSGEAVGTSFFVAPRLMLTCAHVVAEAYQRKQPVTIRWQGQEYLAHVTQFLEEPYPDLALLQLDAMATTHPCVLLDAAVQLDDSLYCYGYPDRYPNGDPATFLYEGMAGEPIRLLKLKQGESRRGFSGSPLLNRRTGAVCGLLKSTRGEDSLLGGRAVPADVILAQFPQLLTFQQQFHQADQRWVSFLSPSQRDLLRLTPPEAVRQPVEVYYSYVKEDAAFAKKLQKHLTMLKRVGYITEWYPGEVAPGGELDTLNRQHLNTARIILLLVSSDYLFEKSDDASGNSEIDLAMARSAAGAIVIPILLRETDNLDLTPFGKLLMLPRNGRPIQKWTSSDAPLAEIAREIRQVVDHLRKA